MSFLWPGFSKKKDAEEEEEERLDLEDIAGLDVRGSGQLPPSAGASEGAKESDAEEEKGDEPKLRAEEMKDAESKLGAEEKEAEEKKDAALMQGGE